LEFNKNAKKIVVSHSRTFEEAKKATEQTGKSADTEKPKRAPRKAKTNVIEKTTLGDISELAALKEEMEEKANKTSAE
jgi:small subunit ribosomal protein S1